MSTQAFGGRLPVMLTFDVDGESNWLARDPRNQERPVTLSMGAYGPKVGLRRVLDVLRRYDIRSTFFVPGWVIERWKPQISEIVEAGHEIAHHGWLHEWVDELDDEVKEREALEKGIDAIERLTGRRPAGYRSAGEFSRHTLRLLGAAGFEYSSIFMDDDSPYLHEPVAGGEPLVELPVQWQLDDAPFSAFSLRLQGRQLYSPATVYEIWRWEFDALAREEGRTFMLMCHPQYIGRAGRMAMLAQFIEHCAENPRTWFARCDEVAAAYRAQVTETTDARS